MQFRFVHASDLHLDKPFIGIESLPEPTTGSLLDASLKAFDALIDLTLQQEAAFLLLAGDCYEGLKHGVRAQKRFRQGMERLAEKRIPVFIVRGANDPAQGTAGDWLSVQSRPNNITYFDGDAFESVPVKLNGRRIATIHGRGCSNGEKLEVGSLPQEKAEGSGLQIALVHGDVAAKESAERTPALTTSQMQETCIDYWALGHGHTFEKLLTDGPWAVYPGTIQGRGYDAEELGAKGAAVVTAGPEGVEDVAFHALDRVRFVTLPFRVSTMPDPGALRPALADEAHELMKKHKGRSLIVRTRLCGEGEMARALARRSFRAEMLEALRGDFKNVKPLLWWESLEEEFTEPGDLEQIRGRNDIVSMLLKGADQMAENVQALDDDLARAIEPIAKALNQIKAGFLEPTAGAEQILILLAAAEARAMAQLNQEEAP